MKHIFILNPVAGKGKADTEFLPKILEAVKKAGVEYEIHRTFNKGDGSRFVKNRCLMNQEAIRFYAVGGDGTLNEVVNGLVGFQHAEIAFIPAGTGNDFARIFPNYKFFKDITRQLQGKAKPIDLIRYNDSYLINMMNIGLDCDVATKVDQIKDKNLFKGTMAYVAGVGIVFVGNKGIDLEIDLDNGQAYRGQFTLVAIGNGAFCGGGFKGVPKARPDDGLLDVSLIKKVNRRTFLSLIGPYHKGTHLDMQKAQDVISYYQCRSVSIRNPKGEEIKICADGEVKYANELKLDLMPGMMQFSVPLGCEQPNE